MLKRIQQNLAVVALVSFAIVSCQKETPPAPAASVASPNTKATTSLIVTGPPTLLAWLNGAAIPYTDNIPGDVPIRNGWVHGFAINGKGYVLGTYLTTSMVTSDYVGDLWEDDPGATGWIKKTSFPDDPGVLVSAVTFAIGDNAYVVAGNKTWQYNQPTDTWTRKANSPVQRDLGTAIVINGIGYVGLGTSSINNQFLNDWWQYDPVANHWTQKGNFPGGKRAGASGFAIDGKGYVVLGSNGSDTDPNWGTRLWQYNPVTDNWAQRAVFPGGRDWGASAVNATIGGVDVGLVAATDATAWEYLPTTDAWYQLTNYPGGGRAFTGAFVIGKSFVMADISTVVLIWTN